MILIYLLPGAVYGVLPISCIFLVLYSYATQKFSRATLFNIVVSVFLALYTGFALLYPHHEVMHLDGFATHMLENYPVGFAGAIGMVRNWMFTLFYCTSELWGDVVLSLLFWGLANETTSLRDAPLLYPLFGVGANVAQTLAGRILSAFSSTTANKLSYAQQVQACMCMVLALGAGILALHRYINVRFPHNYGDITKPVALATTKLSSVTASFSAPADSSLNSSGHSADAHSSASASTSASSSPSSNGSTAHSSPEAGTRFQASLAGSSSGEASTSSSTADSGSSSSSSQKQHGGRSKLGFKQAVVFLARSPQIRCLAMMALAQGLTTNLLDVAWKQHLHMLHPSPAAYSVSPPHLPDVVLYCYHSDPACTCTACAIVLLPHSLLCGCIWSSFQGCGMAPACLVQDIPSTTAHQHTYLVPWVTNPFWHDSRVKRVCRRSWVRWPCGQGWSQAPSCLCPLSFSTGWDGEGLQAPPPPSCFGLACPSLGEWRCTLSCHPVPPLPLCGRLLSKSSSLSVPSFRSLLLLLPAFTHSQLYLHPRPSMPLSRPLSVPASCKYSYHWACTSSFCEGNLTMAYVTGTVSCQPLMCTSNTLDCKHRHSHCEHRAGSHICNLV